LTIIWKTCFFPILAHPATGTVLFAVVEESYPNLVFQVKLNSCGAKQFCIKYYIHSLHNAVDICRKNTDHNNPKSLCYYQYKEAVKKYNAICESEKSKDEFFGLGHQLENILRKINYYYSSKKQNDVITLISKQKLYYGFYPNLLRKYASKPTVDVSIASNLI